MMNLKSFHSMLFFIAAICLLGCSDDFVDVESDDQNSENFFNTEEDYQNALIAAYDLLQSTYLNVMLGEIASDNTLAGGESATDVIGIQQVDDMIHTPQNDQLRDIWSWMFAGVNRANYILEFQDNIDFADKPNVIAQAKFLRAYYYFELVKWFGDVPLYTNERFLFGDQFEVDRTPADLVYDQIILDLEEAIVDLPVTPSELGRVTRGAAQALLGKAHLYDGNFNQASVVLEELIGSSTYDLVMDYENLFVIENDIESVFEVQYTDVEGAGFGCLQCSEGNVAVGFNGIRNYSGPRYDSGFSFNVPTQEAYDAFEPNDIRRDVAILDIDAFAAANNATFNTGFEHTGYFNNKYLPLQGDSNIGDQNLTNPNNYISIRFADVLLMAAEAAAKGTAGEDLARTHLNRVRNRAGLMDVNFTGTALLDAIQQERRVELVGEGHRFFDLVRTGRAATEIDGFTPGKNELFPIPLVEITLSGNRWQQNPGY